MNKRIKWILGAAAVAGLIISYLAYNAVLSPNTHAPEGDFFYIASTDNYDSVELHLVEQGVIEDVQSFKLLAKRMRYPQGVKAGKYLIAEGMSNLKIIRLLRSGKWEKEVIKIQAETSRDSLLRYLGQMLECEESQLDSLLSSSWVTDRDFTNENVWSIFLPDHYHFNWATPADAVLERFYTEYQRFWNKERLGQAYAMDLSAEEACALASIVDGEAVHVSEMPTIAGLYLNRLKKGMPLQADPTILYIVGREGRQRVLNADLQREDPYNTYKHTGLPPGPIMLADKRAIEAVLNPKDHNYIYMCAKEDGSYYHYFTASYAQHLRNAAKYRRSLNRRGVRR